MQSEVANVEQAAAWDGDEGDHWVEHADRYEAAAGRYNRWLAGGARISPGERVLDIGCGCGISTREAARATRSGTVLGVDLSAKMLQVARDRARAEGLSNVTFEQADAQVHPFDREAFDVVISRFGCMFFNDPVAAFTNIGQAVRAGGRLALACWTELAKNEWVSALRAALAAGRTLPEPPPGAPGPFGLADPAAVRRILSAAGFRDVDFQEAREPMNFGVDVDDAFGFMSTLRFATMMLADLDDNARAATLENLRAVLAAHQTEEGVQFDSSAWIITASE